MKYSPIKVVSEGEFKMKIEIWSDYVCPFCYIGKRESLHWSSSLIQMKWSLNIEALNLIRKHPCTQAKVCIKYFLRNMV